MIIRQPIKKLSTLALIGCASQFVLAESITFDELSDGALSGQADWTAHEKYLVADDPTGGTSAFSGKVVTIGTEETFDWAIAPRDYGTIAEISVDFSMADDSADEEKPEAFFVRFDGWNSFVAIKPTEGILEVNQQTIPVAITYDDVHNYTVKYHLNGTIATSADLYLDGEYVGTVEGLSSDMAAGTLVEFRSARSTVVVDNIEIIHAPRSTWSFGELELGALGGQPGWAANEKYSVVEDPTGDTSRFSGNVLGNTAEPTFDWVAAERPLGTIVEYSMDFWLADDSSEAEKPIALFVRFNGWDSFVAIKPTDGWLEVNQVLIPIVVPYETVHNFTVRYTLEGTVAVSADLYFNGNYVGTAEDLSSDMSAGSMIEYRCVRSTAYVDNLTLTYASDAHEFETIPLGQINGRLGWNALEKYTVVEDPTGGTTAFSGNVLAMGTEPAFDWATTPRSSGTISSFSMDFWMGEDSSEEGKPEAVFVRFDGWDNFVAVKPADQVLEVNQQTLPADIAYGEVHNLRVEYVLSGSVAVAADVYLNNLFVGTIEELSIDMTSGSLLETRSARSTVFVDNILLTYNSQSFDFNNLGKGELNAQGAWVAPAHVQVVEDTSLDESPFSGNILEIGSLEAQNTEWAMHPIKSMTITELSFDFLLSDDAPVDRSPGLFLRVNGWDNFIAIKPAEMSTAIEIAQEGVLAAEIPYDAVHNFTVIYDVYGTTAVAAEAFVNGVSIGVLEGMSLEMGSGSMIDIRTTGCSAALDNILITGAGPLAEMPTLPWNDPALVEGDIVQSDLFGPFEYAADGWIRSVGQGWLSVEFVESLDSMWLYSLLFESWLWSNEDLYPVVWDTASANWIFFFVLSDEQGYLVYNYTDSTWTWYL